MTEWRRLCRRCYGAAVEREQAKVRPFPFVLEAGSMTRVEASAGQCDLCGFEPATWKGEAGRLCDACYRRELYRAVECGQDAISP